MPSRLTSFGQTFNQSMNQSIIEMSHIYIYTTQVAWINCSFQTSAILFVNKILNVRDIKTWPS